MSTKQEKMDVQEIDTCSSCKDKAAAYATKFLERHDREGKVVPVEDIHLFLAWVRTGIDGFENSTNKTCCSFIMDYRMAISELGDEKDEDKKMIYAFLDDDDDEDANLELHMTTWNRDAKHKLFGNIKLF